MNTQTSYEASDQTQITYELITDASERSKSIDKLYQGKFKANQDISHIPGESGLPFIGSSIELIHNPRKYFARLQSKYGDVHRGNVMFEPFVSFHGPEATKIILKDEEQNFSSKFGWANLAGRYLYDGLMLQDFAHHKLNRKILNEAFKRESLKGYSELMNPIIESEIEELKGKSSIKCYDFIKQLTLDIALVAFLGLELTKENQKINRAFINMTLATVGIVRVPIFGNAMWKGDRAHTYLVNKIRDLIPLKRENPSKDMLSILVNSKNDCGDFFSAQQIVDHMIFLLVAAHDTTSSALTNMIYHVSKDKKWQKIIRKESEDLNEKLCSYNNLDKLEMIDYCLKESLRLLPPVRMIPRRTVKNCFINNHYIPANTQIWVSPEYNHRMPEYWTNPDEFDPLRFAANRQEDKQHKYLYIPYGHGAHLCIGKQFSVIQSRLISHQLFKTFETSIFDGYKAKHRILPFSKPKGGLPLKLKPLI
jgi:cytochrome P450